MKRFTLKIPRVLFLLSLAFTVTAPVFSEPSNLNLAITDVKDYYNSGLYQQELELKIKKAQNYIVEQVLINKKSQQRQKLALVLDIDETSLSNYKMMVKRNFGGNKGQIHKEILAASAPVIKPTLALYQTALKHGIKVFFVTGRTESERNATETNLKKAGYTQWSGLYLRPNQYPHPTIIPFKSGTRALITKQGYTIIASIGDQFSDIKGGYMKKGFKLPNPFYYLP